MVIAIYSIRFFGLTVGSVRQQSDLEAALQLGDRQNVTPTRAGQHVGDRLPVNAAFAGEALGAESLITHRLCESTSEFLRNPRAVMLVSRLSDDLRVRPLSVDDEVTGTPCSGILTGHEIYLDPSGGKVIFAADRRGCYRGSSA